MPKLLSYFILLFVVSTFSCSESPGNSPTTETAAAPDRKDERIKVLIIDGVNNHDWERTTAANKATLEKTGRFDVDVGTSPRRGSSKEEWEAWRPRFSDYQVVVSNFNDDCEVDGGCETPWSSETQADFETFVREGGGFVPVHAADNAFTLWPEYNEMIGIGGWGGRQAGVSGSLLRKVDGEWIASSPDEGLSGEHGDVREFLVIHDQPSHPILEGLPTEWMHAEDELYSALLAQFAFQKLVVGVRETIGDVDSLTSIRNGQEVQGDLFRVTLFDNGFELATSSKHVVRAALSSHIRLWPQLDPFDPTFAGVEEYKDPLTVDGVDSKVARHRLGAAPTVQHDPHVDAVAAHGARKDVVEFVLADHARDLPK